MLDVARVPQRGGDSPRGAAPSPLAIAPAVRGRRVRRRRMQLHLFWGTEAAIVIPEEPGGREAAVHWSCPPA